MLIENIYLISENNNYYVQMSVSCQDKFDDLVRSKLDNI